MYAPGVGELLIILIVAGCPALVVILIIAAFLRGSRTQKDNLAQLDRLERKLDEKAEK